MIEHCDVARDEEAWSFLLKAQLFEFIKAVSVPIASEDSEQDHKWTC